MGQLSLKQLPKIKFKFGDFPQPPPGGLTLTVIPDNGQSVNNQQFTLSRFHFCKGLTTDPINKMVPLSNSLIININGRLI